MKCLSIRQPWASLLVLGLKDIENRNWKTSHRGPLLIHASRLYDSDGAMLLHSTPAYREECLALIKEGYLLPSGFPRGQIIGGVEITDCVTQHASKWFWGKYGYVITAPWTFLSYLPYRGYPGIFDVPDKIIAGIL